MNKQLLICVGLLGAIMDCASLAEPARQSSTADSAGSSAVARTDEQSSKKISKDCDDEWKVNREAMMKGGMTEEAYVQQCSLKDDVPPVAETTTKAAPSSAPK